MESKFNVEGVPYTITGEHLPSETDWKYAVNGHWEHQHVIKSAKFFGERNSIIQAVRNGKLSLLQFAVLLNDSNIFRRNNFLDVEPSTHKMFSGEIKDDLGITQKVEFRGEIEIEELIAPTLLEVYRTWCKESLGEDELTVLTVKRHNALYRRQTGSPLPERNKEEYWAYLHALDLPTDTERVSEFIAAMVKTAENFAGKFVTDEAEAMRIQTLRELPDIKVEWDKKAADPFTSPTGLIVGEQTADTRLLVELQSLAKEAYVTAQTMESKKGISLFEQLKNLLPKRHGGILLFPKDAKEGA